MDRDRQCVWQKLTIDFFTVLLWSRQSPVDVTGPRAILTILFRVRETSMTAFYGLLFPSSFAMRLLGGSVTAYGDELGRVW
jgi:hypothetical protein